jgi:GNAT superfamily N-acetyltransferase
MIEIREMADDYILDRCPLGAPLDPSAFPADEYPGYAARARGVRRRFFSQVRERYGNCVFMAWDEGKMVGFLMFFPKPVARKLGISTLPAGPLDDQTLVYACMQFVPEYRGQGLGTRLVDALIAWAKAHGWRQIEVHGIGSGADDEDWRWGWALPKWQRMGLQATGDEPPFSAVLDLDGEETADAVTSTNG